MSKFKNTWPFIAITPTVEYYYRQIVLYPVTDSSTWPFPIRAQNAPMFQDAMVWLALNNIDILGSVEYGNPDSQLLNIKFTNEVDMLAFTLRFGELMVSVYP